MTLFWICVKIFFARILDVTIGTLRQTAMLKGRVYLMAILAFIETMIWFMVAREALTIDISSILIPIFYSLGYATGTLIGSFLSHQVMKGEVGMQVIIDENDSLLKSLKIRGYQVSIINLENDFQGKKKKMLFLEVNSKSIKKVEKLILKSSPNAFITISDTKKVLNGTIK